MMNDNEQNIPNPNNEQAPQDQHTPESTDTGSTDGQQQYVPETSAEPEQTEPSNQEWTRSNPELQKITDAVSKIRTEIKKVIIGQDHMIDLLLAGILTQGHVLIEGVPGIAKTLTAKLLAKTIAADFSRIQFTPDLMPTDILGTPVFNVKESEFFFKKGPIFTNIALIDEINRAPAKTQAAMFEVMEERQISVDGTTYNLEFPFFVVATQNPIEQEGTYKLPEAQLDRFLFRIKINYPDLLEEEQILLRFRNDTPSDIDVKPVITPAELKECLNIVDKVYIKDELVKYIARIVHDTRNNGDLYLGASPRASLAIMRTSKAIAAISGRDFVTPDDIQFVCYPVLNHRVMLAPEREMEGTEVESVIKDILNKIEVPR